MIVFAALTSNTNINKKRFGDCSQQAFGRIASWNLGQRLAVSWIERETLMRYAVVLEKGKTNFSAYVPDLPGCVATGRTKKETLREIEEAIAFHLDGMKREGLPIPKASTQTEYVEVA